MAVDATAMVGGRSDSTPRQNGASARRAAATGAIERRRTTYKCKTL